MIVNFLSRIGQIWLKQPINRLTQISLVLVISQITLIVFYFDKLPNQVPLFYSLPWGVKQLAPPEYLFLLPGISSLFLILNLSLTAIAKNESQDFFALIMGWGNLIISLTSLITLSEIIFLIS